MSIKEKLSKNILLIALTAALIFSAAFAVAISTPNTAQAADNAAGFASGSGTSADPYILTTPKHLDNLRNYLGEGNSNNYYKLASDIDLTSYLSASGEGYNDGAGWESIGSDSYAFCGNLDGNGFKVTGLWVNRSSDMYMGLFLYFSGTVKNLGVEIPEDKEVKGYSWTGGLAGRNYGTIENCYVIGSVTATMSCVGGLVGANFGSITNCYATGNMAGHSYIGGLVGRTDPGSIITNSYASGNVMGTERVGRLIGSRYQDNVTACYYLSDGNISGVGSGGSSGVSGLTADEMRDSDNFTGWDFENVWVMRYNAPVLKVFTCGDCGGERTDTGYLHICGKGCTGAAAEHSHGDWLTNKTQHWHQCEICNAKIDKANHSISDWIIDIAMTETTDGEMHKECTVCKLVLEAVVTTWFSSGNGSEQNPYIVSTARQLSGIRNYLGSANKDVYFRLGNDIDLTAYLNSGGEGYGDGQGWNPVGNGENGFYGNLDGNGFKVTGLWIIRSSTNTIGLFGELCGTVKNLGVEIMGNSLVHGLGNVGGLVGRNYGSIINCYVSGAVKEGFGGQAGGLVGINFGGSIVNCYASGSVMGTVRTGGLVGNNYDGSITNSYATGNVSGSGEIGGLCGVIFGGSITNCYAAGTVTGTTNAGCLIGNFDRGTITNCFYLMDVDDGKPGVGSNAAATGVTGLTADEMADSENFTGWDFDTDSGAVDSVWFMGDNAPLFCTLLCGVCDVYSGHVECEDCGAKCNGTRYIHICGSACGGADNAHSPGGWITSETRHWHVCETCGEIPYAANHGGGEASCTELAECTACGAEYGELTPHTESDWMIAVLPTDTTDGERYKKCTGCGEILRTGYITFIYGSGTETDPYIVNTARQLNSIRDYLGAEYTDFYFKLGNDIDLSAYLSASGEGYNDGAGWESIGSDSYAFCGNLDGNGFKVTGLWINRPSQVEAGLFGVIKGTVQNLGVEISTLTFAEIGINAETDIVGVRGGYYVGGLVGRNDGVITSCYAAGSVNGAFDAGGLVGGNDGSITACYATGAVEGVRYVGGLVGLNESRSSIEDCYAAADVTSTDGAGAAGGFVGYNGGIIRNCYATGTVTGANDKGWFAGVSQSGLDMCFCRNDINAGMSGVGRGTGSAFGLTVDQMQDVATFTTRGAEWNFTAVWYMGDDAPLLRAFLCGECGEYSGHLTCHDCGVKCDGTSYIHICGGGCGGAGTHSGGTTTCTEKAVCSTCGEKYGSLAEHSFTNYVSNGDATCASDGTERAICDYEGCTESHTRTAIGSMLPHGYGSDWKSDETAHWHECTDCPDKTCEAVHIESDWITDKAATETEDGTKHKECTVCGYEMETGIIPATGSGHTHDYGTDWKSNDTHHWHECDCGEKSGESVHSGGTATCTDKAVCETCDTEYGVVDSANHAGGTELRNALAASETVDGYTGDTHCKGCGELLSQGTVIPATGTPHTHDYGDWMHKDDTHHQRECDTCHETETAAHSFDGGVVTAPTYFASGYTTYTCADCGHSYTGNPVAKLIYSVNAAKDSNVPDDFLDGYVLGETLGTPSREGYTFGGWYLDADFEQAVTSVTAANLKSDGSVTLYAKWTLNNSPEKDGLSGGAIAGIVIGSVALAVIAGFAVYWFAVKKKRFSDIARLFKKTPKE